ncbi:MAG: glucosamine-6-phosphate deaminase, partial [Desulfobulbaceae bacterium]|nr:glucosamine-6-phosphate deaminase [Desulfobulbaceae bacterium]
MIAKRIVELFIAKPNAILGLATGSSPLPTYRAIRRHFEAGNITFARAEAFTLDEYLGLPDDHPELYRTVIRRELTDHLDFAPGAVHSP